MAGADNGHILVECDVAVQRIFVSSQDNGGIILGVVNGILQRRDEPVIGGSTALIDNGDLRAVFYSGFGHKINRCEDIVPHCNKCVVTISYCNCHISCISTLDIASICIDEVHAYQGSIGHIQGGAGGTADIFAKAHIDAVLAIPGEVNGTDSSYSGGVYVDTALGIVRGGYVFQPTICSRIELDTVTTLVAAIHLNILDGGIIGSNSNDITAKCFGGLDSKIIAVDGDRSINYQGAGELDVALQRDDIAGCSFV